MKQNVLAHGITCHLVYNDIMKKCSSCSSYISILSRATRKNLIVSIVTIVGKNGVGVGVQMSLILIHDLTRLYPCHRTL